MMTNLFSIFDPTNSNNLAMNWLSMFSWIFLMPVFFWPLMNRNMKTIQNLMNYLFSEYSPLMKKNPQTLILTISFFSFIMFNNLPGLLPFIFTATSHMTATLTLALPLWLGLMIHGWMFNTSNLLVHLIPNGTPTILMPFMVLIETVSNIIRPLTLAIRLAANMIAGHLLITLLTSATPITPLLLTPVIFSAQLALAVLETAVAFIQAYVFSVLVTLYTSESVS